MCCTLAWPSYGRAESNALCNVLLKNILPNPKICLIKNLKHLNSTMVPINATVVVAAYTGFPRTTILVCVTIAAIPFHGSSEIDKHK